MRRKENNDKIVVRCNNCGKDIKTNKDIAVEGLLSLNVDWGYFSEKDGEVHEIDICEECYDKWISQFKIPIDIVRKNEML